MPNWCSNNLKLTHDDPTEIDRAIAAFTADKFLNTFIPRPVEEEDNWYSWNIQNWGTKWDVGGREDQVERIDPNTVKFTFDSAWSPPVRSYETLTENGWVVDATYYESGMAFVGEYDSIHGDNYFEIPQTADEVVDAIPEHLDEEWGISSYMRACEEEAAEFEEENEDDEENQEILPQDAELEDTDEDDEEDPKE